MHMNNHTNTNIGVPSNTKYTWGGLGVIALIAAIAGLAIFLYFINAPKPLNFEIINERKARLADVNAKQNELITQYAWVDQAKGIVRIPVERSMQLTVEELRHGKKQDSSSSSGNNKNQNESES